ncbi:MAG: hypothetical protein ACRD35_09170 [Candidatus Acidiferrales bacterium]
MRKPALAVAFLLVFAVPGLCAQSKSRLPQLIVTARYVMVTTMQGIEPSPTVPPEDLRAVADVQAAIQKWGHYTLVYKPEQADLIIAVRRGRLASVTPTIEIGRSSDKSEEKTGYGLGAEAGNPYDLFAVYNARTGGLDSPALWRASEKKGLNPPDLPLFKKFQKEVERAAAKTP